ncbi:Atrial natriuretic peptide receptor 2 [Hypsibius exemplaris]|uniref:Guanylate cyclase n=1 Tax=Hypsibius exemplaris TaxID=2072580 RepID=A0A9X6RLB3_HYPEX|nr:Atrial natriuretic peptide receptor 2 [Hypsibius exemplaris]
MADCLQQRLFVRLVGLLLLSTVAIAAPTRLKLGIVLNVHSTLSFEYYNMEPAIALAVNRSLDRYGIAYDTFLSLYEGGCSELAALTSTVRALNASVDVLLGPGCSDDLIGASKLATVYKVALMTGGGTVIDSTENWPYVTRTGYNTNTQWSFFGLLCRRFNWSNVFVLYDTDTVSGSSGINLVRYMRDNRLVPSDYPIKSTDVFSLKRVDGILDEMTNRARVVMVLVSAKRARQLMIQAQRRGMCNGDYAFFTLDTLRTDILDPKGWQPTNNLDDGSQQDVAQNFCQAFFVLTLRFSQADPKFKAFAKRVLQGVQVPLGAAPPIVNYNAFHDAVLVYAAVINETVTEGHTTDDADYIAAKFNNRIFEGSIGLVYLDNHSDRADDYQLYQMGPSSERMRRDVDTDTTTFGQFVLVAEFYGYRGIYENITPIVWLNAANKPVINKPLCDFDGNDPVCVEAAKSALGGSLGGIFLLLVLVGIVAFYVHRHLLWRSQLANLDWLAAWDEIHVHQHSASTRSISLTSHGGQPEIPNRDGDPTTASVPTTQRVKSTVRRLKSMSVHSVQKSSGNNSSFMRTNTIAASFRGTLTLMRVCPSAHVQLSNELRAEVRQVKSLACESLMKFVAACIEPDHVVVLNEFCSRGTLQEVLQNNVVALDWVFRFSFINDMVEALLYLHGDLLQQHGRLTSKCCYIDKRFLLKIADYGLPSFYDVPAKAVEPGEQLWTAPEILRAKSSNEQARVAPEADVYAFGIILSEIVLRESAFFFNDTIAEDIIKRVGRGQRPAFRPIVQDSFCPEEVMYIMKLCWAEDPAERPKFAQIRASFRNPALFSYAVSLEVSVDEKTQALIEEKKKTEQLLYSILPRTVAEQLKRGEAVLPESYDSVTIYFGDIVGFTTLSAASSPTEIVTLMNDLYSRFDGIILTFDAYKVETIGDCYVIVSGLPHRNGQKHAGIIARMAITLRDSMVTFRVQHMPGKVLQLRIGLNSGPCVAGVVGFATPRYCLFGDTVNTASRMESTGEPMRIQITQTTETILRYLGSFTLELRGAVNIKGKGEMNTFWLINEHPLG